MSDHWRIRPVTDADLATICRMEQQCFSDPWNEDMIRSELQQEQAQWYAAVCGDIICGYIAMRQLFDEAEVINIAVSPEHRRAGIGMALLSHGISALQDIQRVFLEVRLSNIQAASLYEKFGFTRIAIRKRYYHNPVEDAIIMMYEFPSDNQQ